ncbi:Cullin binding-domain-containing protein [Trichophaea hybrida]|nr:Cullin binding-domain-containing protein [Trichophaea hybrida]
MPPKKKIKSTTTIATTGGVTISTRRATRASTRNNAALAMVAKEASLVADMRSNGKRKRGVAVSHPISIESESKVGYIPTHTERPIANALSKNSAKSVAPVPTLNAVQKWFQRYANPETNRIDPLTFQKWMDDLDVSSDGAFMYFILWRCNATTQMTITHDEFKTCMDGIGANSNEKLLSKLPELMDTIRPKASPAPNHTFKSFYKWCFHHFRPESQKNIPVEFAQVLFQTLLDGEKYTPSWKPRNTINGDLLTGRTFGDFPHVNAFVEFLNSEPKPASVITKDQYEQFYEFNASVSWELKEHSEDSAWPALIDSYVAWKKSNHQDEIR